MTATPTVYNPAELRHLTGLRGLAAWFVVLFHIRWLFYPLWPSWLIATADHGYLAVDLFFMLSGFVMWLNYAQRLRSGGWVETRRFWWRRFARIWPLHGFMLLGFVALAILDSLRGRPMAQAPLAELPLNFALMQNWGFTNALGWNIPSWSISTEAGAYLLFPLLVAMGAWQRVSLPGLAAITALLLIILHLLYAAHGETYLGADIGRYGLRRCLIEFALGNIIAMLWMHARQLPEKTRDLACGLATASCAACLLAGGWFSLPDTAFVPAAFFTGLLGLTLSRGLMVRLLGAKLPHHLGEISYSTYMAHALLFILFKAAFVPKTGPQPGWLALFGFLAVVLVVSEVLHNGVEMPAQRWLNRRAPDRGQRKMAALSAPLPLAGGECTRI